MSTTKIEIRFMPKNQPPFSQTEWPNAFGVGWDLVGRRSSAFGPEKILHFADMRGVKTGEIRA
jgi:hypothetical protein